MRTDSESISGSAEDICAEERHGLNVRCDRLQRWRAVREPDRRTRILNVTVETELVKLHLNPDGWGHPHLVEIDHQFMHALRRLGSDLGTHSPRRALYLQNPANVAILLRTGVGVDLKDLMLRSSQSKQ